LDAGYIMLGSFDAKTALPAWWRVDPASGATDARLADLGNNSRGVIPSVHTYVNASGGQKSFRADAYVRRTPRTPHPSFPRGGGGGNEDLTVRHIVMISIIPVGLTGYLIYRLYLR
jgi:hypothetical protein